LKRRQFLAGSGFSIKRVYRATDLDQEHLETEMEELGPYLFTRGMHCEMFRERLRRVQQYTGLGGVSLA
jgi:hypothetical protein